jgi:DNA polymerase elongation subunit (family B)
MTKEFQIIDFCEDHEIEDDEDDEGNCEAIEKYIIHIFGRTLEGQSVYLKVQDFHPYFYVKLPRVIKNQEGKSFIKKMSSFLREEKRIWYKYRGGLLKVLLKEEIDADGFTNNKKSLFAKLVFNSLKAMRQFKMFFEKNLIKIPNTTNKEFYYKTYEANLPPMLRFCHLRKIPGCSWVSIKKYREIKESSKDSRCDIELNCNWKNVDPIKKDVNAPIRIMSFDLECYSEDGSFPLAKRDSDKIIQIGSTYTYLGQSTPYRQHIVCLKDTDDVVDTITESYNTEEKLLRGWIEEFKKSDCDILTGYNTFFFDEKYLYERCRKVGLEENIMKISKLKRYKCNFRDFKLASSAMGENRLRLFNTPGIVHIDLMKEVQKSEFLTSYKLDYVASKFIRSQITNIEKISKNYYTLTCNSTNDIYEEDFIHIEINKGFVNDCIGHKYVVKSIDHDNKTVMIYSKENLEEVDTTEGKLFWSQAKDDITPEDIFASHRQTSKERSLIAKYCVKDCKLVNLLINKLEIVTKNIEMSNVCYVPLQFLFTRGQSIKLFSLCLKYYKEAGYVFPVQLRDINYVDYKDGKQKSGTIVWEKYEEDETKPKDIMIKIKNEDNELQIIKTNTTKIEIQKNSSYEGAIVFEPVPRVDYEAQTVKDYASLYPRTIIQKNMSHETLVKDDTYDNLPGVKYYNACYNKTNGEVKYCRFAQVDDKLGVIPYILNILLNERSAVKKSLKTEKDEFKYKIKDGKQLALKVTANSLYGQLGAGLSQVRNKDVAACCTAGGREMLIFAKKSDEELLPNIINGLKYAYLNKKEDKYILDLELKDRDNEKLLKQIKKFTSESIKDYIFQPIIRYGDTDSIFTSYRFRENSKLIEHKEALFIFKEMIKFSLDFVKYFIPIEYQCIFENLHSEYYDTKLIKGLKLPKGPDVMDKPSHWKTILPIQERLKQFLKEYMEESYFPWLWTVQEIYLTKYKTKDIFEKTLHVKYYEMGCDQVTKFREICDSEQLEMIKEQVKESEFIKNFVQEHLKGIWIQPRWVVKDKDKVKEYHYDIYTEGNIITDDRTLKLSIDLGIISGELVKSRLPFPHDLEYEKTYWPYLILTKKKYVGNKYEFDYNKFKQDFMGIVLKRRDNAPIVKEICNGIIKCLINERSVNNAKEFTKKYISDMFDNKFDIKYFTTSKTLKMKESYKDWTRIPHSVLAERIGSRDLGNKPQSGDRLEYAIIKIDNETKDTLQGEKIETPEFIKQNNLSLDYTFYLTNQIMNPVLQFLDLVILDAETIFEGYLPKKKQRKTKEEQEQEKEEKKLEREKIREIKRLERENLKEEKRLERERIKEKAREEKNAKKSKNPKMDKKDDDKKVNDIEC